MCEVVQYKVAAPWIFSRGRQSLRMCCTPGLPVRATRYAACYMLPLHMLRAHKLNIAWRWIYPWLHVTTQYWEIGPQHHLDSW